MEIEVVDGDKNILNPNILKFNAFGLENVKPLRNVYDGVTHFGSKKLHDDSLRKAGSPIKTLGLFYNDYVFDTAAPSSFGDRHFSIAYNKGMTTNNHNKS